jgi:hypothetical protein
MIKRQVVLATLLVVACTSLVQATTLSGRVGLSSYLWRYREADTTETRNTRHLQNTGTLGLRLGQIAGQDLEVLTSMRGRFDVRNTGDNLSDYHVYDLQVRWRNIGQAVDLTGGRHRVFWPNGTVSIDGGSATIHPKCGAELSGYIGLIAPEDGRFKMTTYDRGHAFGAKLGYHSSLIGNLALSYAQKNLARTYGTTEVNNLASQTVGLDWKRTVKGFGSVYGQALYQVPTQRLDRVHMSARWHANDCLSVNAQFRYHRPDLAYNSIFWVFGESRYYEGRLQLSYRLNPTWSVNAGGVHVDLAGGKSERFELGVSHKYFSLALNGKTGWSGKTIGGSGEASYPINDQWTVRGGVHVSDFGLIQSSYYEVLPDSSKPKSNSNSEASSSAGVSWSGIPQLTVDAELQYVTQSIKVDPSYGDGSSDIRFMLRLSWWFFNHLGSKVG